MIYEEKCCEEKKEKEEKEERREKWSKQLNTIFNVGHLVSQVRSRFPWYS